MVMSAEHTHGPAAYDRAFAVGVGLNIVFVVTEAAFGVIAGFTVLLFLRGRRDDLNIRGAFLYMAADAAVGARPGRVLPSGSVTRQP
jgi:Co/Zn/Cd efflux system component